MKAQQLEGKTIRKVHQYRHGIGEHRTICWAIDAVEFTDGTFLRLVVLEGDVDYGVEGVYPARPVGGE